jgi:hypothetical protein
MSIATIFPRLTVKPTTETVAHPESRRLLRLRSRAPLRQPAKPREAEPQFYHKALGGHLDLQTGPGDSIRHARLEADGVLIMASDGHPDYPAKVGENMAIALDGTDQRENSAA